MPQKYVITFFLSPEIQVFCHLVQMSSLPGVVYLPFIIFTIHFLTDEREIHLLLNPLIIALYRKECNRCGCKLVDHNVDMNKNIHERIFYELLGAKHDFSFNDTLSDNSSLVQKTSIGMTKRQPFHRKTFTARSQMFLKSKDEDLDEVMTIMRPYVCVACMIFILLKKKMVFLFCIKNYVRLPN